MRVGFAAMKCMMFFLIEKTKHVGPHGNYCNYYKEKPYQFGRKFAISSEDVSPSIISAGHFEPPLKKSCAKPLRKDY